MSLAHAFRNRGKRAVIALLGLVTAALAIASARTQVVVVGALSVPVLAVFGLLAWRFVLDQGERTAIQRAVAVTRRSGQ